MSEAVKKGPSNGFEKMLPSAEQQAKVTSLDAAFSSHLK